MISVCFSGAAVGADTAFHHAATDAKHSVVHYSFEGHRSNVDSEAVIVLSEKELKIADKALKTANNRLGRKIPYNQYGKNLLRRNFYQIELVTSVYAVSTLLDKHRISGGTAWACQMFIDRHFSFDDFIPLYVFDQVKEQWFQYNKVAGYTAIDAPPTPEGLYTGIGSRDLTNVGEDAIKRLYT